MSPKNKDPWEEVQKGKEYRDAGIDRLMSVEMHQKTFSAAAVMVIKGDAVVHRAFYGRDKMGGGSKSIDEKSLFDLASLTKPLGSGLLTLFLTGRGALDIRSNLSQFGDAFRDDKFKNITIDMLLDHSAGFPALWGLWEFLEKNPENIKIGTRAIVPVYQKHFREIDLVTEPGRVTCYSDVGFIALGWALEAAVGKSLDVALRERILMPMDIERELFFVPLDDAKFRKTLAARTFVATEECPRRGLLQGEVHDPEAWAMGGVAGHAGMFGTLDGVWRLVYALKRAYQGATDTLFHSGAVQRFWTRSKRVPNTTRTLAWDMPSALDSTVGQRFSRTSVGHLGYTGTSIWIDLKNDIIGIVLTNAVHPTYPDDKKKTMRAFRQHIYDEIFRAAGVN